MVRKKFQIEKIWIFLLKSKNKNLALAFENQNKKNVPQDQKEHSSKTKEKAFGHPIINNCPQLPKSKSNYF